MDRRNEIGSVTPSSFDFEADPPTLTVQARHSKHRRTDVVPLRSDFATRIRRWIEQKPELRRDSQLFNVRDQRTAEMIRWDLEQARIAWIAEGTAQEERKQRDNSSFLAYINERGHYADFHALRKTFITNLSRARVSPKMAQMLARHSDINLTMNTYTMLDVLDQAAAVESLPPIPQSQLPTDVRSLRCEGF